MADTKNMGKQAVVLAGGKGSRLGPYTTVLPKPLLPIGDHSILDVVVRQLRFYGFDELTLAVGYLAHLVRAVFADGSDHGVSIRYHEEKTPLGTAGALGSLEGLADEPFLVMNGDVLTTLDYSALYQAHIESDDLLTIATHRRSVQIDYGVLECDPGEGSECRTVTGYDEKPTIDYIVSMGVYIVSPEIQRYVPAGEHLDIPELVLKLIAAGEGVGSYLYDGFWLDIGRHSDYEQAIVEYDSFKAELLPAGDDSIASESIV